MASAVRAELSRFCSRAPTAAVPITAPTCRTVFSMPDAAPAICGSMFRMAVVVIGANMQPMPKPAMASAGMKSCQVEWVVAMADGPGRCRPANSISPDIRMYLPPILSVRRPATGATNMEMSDAGAIVRPAFSAENPSTDWR